MMPVLTGGAYRNLGYLKRGLVFILKHFIKCGFNFETFCGNEIVYFLNVFLYYFVVLLMRKEFLRLFLL